MKRHQVLATLSVLLLSSCAAAPGESAGPARDEVATSIPFGAATGSGEGAVRNSASASPVVVDPVVETPTDPAGRAAAAGAPFEVVADPCPQWSALVRTLDEARYAAVRLAVVTAEGPCGVSVRGGEHLWAASTIKLLALAGTLEQYDRGLEPLDQDAFDDLTSMIQWSDNAAATRVIDRLERHGERFSSIGVRWAVPGAQHPRWGLSPVSADEMAQLVSSMFFSDRLSPRSRDIARRLLDLPDANWATHWRVGVGYGTPAGWYRGSKVGALGCGDGFCVHGVGLVVAPDGTSYAVALLSDGWSNDADGADILNEIGQKASDAMVAAELIEHL